MQISLILGFLSILMVAVICALPKTGLSNDVYNGPDLAGPAIPTQIDEGFSLEDLSIAHKTCLKDLGQQLMLNLLGEQSGGLGFQAECESRSDRSADAFTPSCLLTEQNGNAPNLRIVGGIGRFYDLQLILFPTSKPHPLDDLGFYASIPYIDFEALVENTYDRFGRVVQKKTSYRELRVLWIPDNRQQKVNVRLKNQNTGVQSIVTYNAERFVACLLTELR